MRTELQEPFLEFHDMHILINLPGKNELARLFERGDNIGQGVDGRFGWRISLRLWL